MNMSHTAIARVLIGSCLLYSAASAQAQELSWASKMFEKQSLDLGVVARGADVSYRLKFTNTNLQPVHVAGVRSSCGCAHAETTTTTLNNGESGYIVINIDTRRHMREKSPNITVTFDAPLYQEVTIPVKVYIRTDVVLTPGGAEFGAVAEGSEQERKVQIAYAGRADWTIKDIINKSEFFNAKVNETHRGDGRVDYDLIVTLKPNAPKGDLRDQIILVTDDKNSPEAPILVEARVEPEISVTPEVVSLGTLLPGQTKTVNVVLRGRKPFSIEKIESESGNEAFQTKLPPATATRLVHVLPLIVTAPDTVGPIDEEFTITLKGISQSVQFKAHGKIEGQASR